MRFHSSYGLGEIMYYFLFRYNKNIFILFIVCILTNENRRRKTRRRIERARFDVVFKNKLLKQRFLFDIMDKWSGNK